MIKNLWFWVSAVLLLFVAYLYNRGELAPQTAVSTPRFAIMLGGSEPFREQVASGAKAAASRYNADIELIVPKEDVSDQTKRLLQVDPGEFDGIAISPLEPDVQSRTIGALATRTKVVTYDNEMLDSVYHRHVGTNNYVAGGTCGQLVKEALPDGGELAIFVGTYDRQNAQLRVQGLVDTLKGAARVPGANLPAIDAPISAGEYTIVATYVDGLKPAVAKENAARALAEHPDLDGMVALYGYNGPMCLEALSEADKLGEIAVIAFDDQEPTLKGIETGSIYATVAQSPYEYGYESVRALLDVSRSEHASTAGLFAVPSTLYVPCTVVKADNLAEYRSQMQALGGAD